MTHTETLAVHLHHLSHRFNVAVVYHESKNIKGRAWRKDRCIRIAPIKSDVTYAIALHEMGHVVGDQPKSRIDREVAAWQWAKTYAISWTPVMQKAASTRLTNYVRWTRRHQTAIVPGPEHPVFKWIGVAA